MNYPTIDEASARIKNKTIVVAEAPSEWPITKDLEELKNMSRSGEAYKQKKRDIQRELADLGYKFGRYRAEAEFGLSRVGENGIVQLPASNRRKNPLLKKPRGGAMHVVVVGRGSGDSGRDVAVREL